MSADEAYRQLKRDKHKGLTEELHRRQNLNTDNFDKAILTYSAGGLAASLAFLKEFVPITGAVLPWLLYASWFLFLGAIALTMISFVVSLRAIEHQLQLNERYYVYDDEAAKDEANPAAVLTVRVNLAAGAFFLLAVISTTVFVAANLERATKLKDGPVNVVPLGAIVPGIQTMQHVQRGAVVPGIQAVPAPAPASNGGQAGGSSTPAPSPAPATPSRSSQGG